MSLVLSSGMLLSAADGLTYPAKNPRIGYHNLLTAATTILTSTTVPPGMEKENLTDYFSWTYWRSANYPATLTIDAGSAQDVDYVGIAGHTLFSDQSSVKVEYSTNATTWTECVSPFYPASNAPLMFIFSAVTARYFRVTLAAVGGGTLPAAIGVLNIGQTLVIPHSLYVGHTPITMRKITDIRPNKTEAGQWIGRSVIRRGNSASVELTHLSADWYRSNFQEFVDHAINYPYFFSWRPDEYPREVGFGWTDEDIIPQLTGPGDMMSVSFEITGIAQ